MRFIIIEKKRKIFKHQDDDKFRHLAKNKFFFLLKEMQNLTNNKEIRFEYLSN